MPAILASQLLSEAMRLKEGIQASLEDAPHVQASSHQLKPFPNSNLTGFQPLPYSTPS